MRVLSRFFVPALLVAICAALLTQWIDPTITDLGRHLRNGQLILEGTAEERASVLRANHYSFAEPDAPFVNHHWLTGVIFFQVWKAFSFPGLTILYIILIATSIMLAYWTAARASNRWAAAALTVLAAPMLAWRWEVRPEAFTFVLLMAFYATLSEWFSGRLPARWLWALPFLMALWINLHIGFVFGFFLFVIFGLKVIRDRTRLITIAGVAGASAVAALANPSGISGLLYPLGILGKTAYPVAELASLAVVRSRGAWAWEYELFLALLALAVLVLGLRWRHVAWPDALMLAIMGGLAVMQVRSIPLFLLLMIPVVANATQSWFEAKAPAAKKGKEAPPTPAWPRWVSAGAVLVGVVCATRVYQERAGSAHLGLQPASERPAQFMRDNAFRGPVFNDFDIGGYLIWHGIPVFTDGRPEAYPAGFFEDGYMPMLVDDAVWQDWDSRYRFNSIVLSMQDGYPGIEAFILTRVRDDEWAPVYADEYAIMFVRNTPENAAVIAQYRIPRERFR